MGLMGWCGNCCGAPGGEGEQGQGAAGHGAEQNNSSGRNVIYNRVGRVEKSKHGGTVLFLGKSVLAALLIILLVQYIANQEVCTINAPLNDLPGGVQKILRGNNLQDSWRCPYDEHFDVSYTFSMVLPTNETATNQTMFKVLMADIKPANNADSEASSISRLSESVTQLCGKSCYVKSCECVKTIIHSKSCFLEKYQYGLQLKPTNHDEVSHSVFGIYFIISAILLIVMVMFYAVYRITTQICGGKRDGFAVIA